MTTDKSSFTCGVTEEACDGRRNGWEEPWDKGNFKYARLGYNTNYWWKYRYGGPRRNGCCICEQGCDHSEESGEKGPICLDHVGAEIATRSAIISLMQWGSS